MNKYVYFCGVLRINIQMNTRKKRLDAIRVLLANRQISSQEDILKALNDDGYAITQSTLSRDMKLLKVAKVSAAHGGYRYMLPGASFYKRVIPPEQIAEKIRLHGFLSISFSGNMGVIKTTPGHAPSIAYQIDNSELDSILGTIAGDDTIFLVVREGVNDADVVNALGRL